MKVIVASYWKTGTKTMNAALRDLGYNVYDALEHFMFHYDDWMKILDGKGSAADFKRMYADVDAVTDYPACVFWKEIHEAFPDAKIILTAKDEESWYKSYLKQCNVLDQESSQYASAYTHWFVPFVRRAKKYFDYWSALNVGRPMKRGWISLLHDPDPMIAKQRFRMHKADVIQNAPNDKLLIFDLKQGWGPLCKFLDKEIPETTFPSKNVSGMDYIPEEYKRKFLLQALKEFFILVVAVAFVLLAFYLYFNNCSYWQSALTLLLGYLIWYFFL